MALVSWTPTKSQVGRFFSVRLVRARAVPSVLVALIMGLGGLVCTWLVVEWSPAVTRAIYLPVVVASGFLLQMPFLLGVYALLLALFVTSVVLTPAVTTNPAITGATVVVTMGIMLWMARSRSRLGTTGMNSDALLTDLRDRLKATARLPHLPAGWGAEIETRSAYGQGLSGDFVVTKRQGDLLQLALVDVSGKGLEAGTRSLILAGAYSSLLGAVPPERFLPEANHFLIEQGWDDNFATAVHVCIDLVTGEYSVGHAGHPAAAVRAAGSGRWLMREGANGCALGIIDEVPFPRAEGHLASGDALLLYTDGLIESRDRPLRQGLDRLLGRADLLVGAGYAGGAEALVRDAAGGVTDDRAAVLIWRR